MLLKILLLLLIYVNYLKCEGPNFQDINTGVGPINFIYYKFLNCANAATPVNLTITPKWLNNSYQVLDAHLFSPFDIGDNVMAKASANLLIRRKLIHVADLSETVCRGIHNYIGPIRHDIFRAIGLPSDTCPIPKGSYHTKNFHLDFKNSRIPALPYGMYNMTLTLHERSTNNLCLCMTILLENNFGKCDKFCNKSILPRNNKLIRRK